MPKATRAAQRQQNQGAGDDDDDDDGDDKPTIGLPARRDAQSAAAGAADEVEQLLETLGARGSEARIIVWRIQANADPEECIDCPLNVFSKDQLREQFGAGRYRCEVRHKGTMKRRWEWRFAAPARAPGAAPSAMSDLRDQRIAELQQQLATSRDRDGQRQHELMLALISRPQSQAPGLGELVGVLSQVKGLVGGDGEKGGALSALREVLEIRELMGEGGGGKTSMEDVVLEGLKQLPRILDAGVAAKPALPAPRPRSGAPGAAARAPAQESKRDQIITILLQHAEQGTSPAAVAQFVYGKLEALDDDAYQTACGYIDSPGALRMALVLEPRLVPAQEWLQKVLEEIRPLISAETGGEALTDPAAGAEGAPEGQPPT